MHMLTMEEAMKQTGALPFAAGNIVKGTIIEVRPKEVLVDIGYKSEGVISANEFEDIKAVKVSDEIDVLIEKLEDKEGMVVLSKEKAEFKQNWDRILTICNEGGVVSGKVKAVVPESEDDIEIDETLEDDDDDDSTFIADEEEGDEDVTDIIGDVSGDEET